MEGLIYALAAAFAFGLWTVFHKQAATHIGNLFGAILVSLTAVILGTVIFLWQGAKLRFTTHGVVFVVLAGISALAIDFFALKAYSAGIPVSVGGPIIIGGSVAVASLIGFFIGEPLTLHRLAGILLIILGSIFLSI